MGMASYEVVFTSWLSNLSVRPYEMNGFLSYKTNGFGIETVYERTGLGIQSRKDARWETFVSRSSWQALAVPLVGHLASARGASGRSGPSCTATLSVEGLTRAISRARAGGVCACAGGTAASRGTTRGRGSCSTLSNGVTVTGLVAPDTSRLVGDGSWASNRLPVDSRVVGTAKPVPSPVAAGLNNTGQVCALTLAAHTTVLSTTIPATVLTRATVVDTNTTSWDEQVELIASEISTSVCGLDDKRLSRESRRRRECESVALAAPA